MPERYDVLVIGAGLFGSIIAKALRDQGRSVLVVDDARKDAGSRPAACLMKPSWFSGLGKDVYEPSLRLLDRLYGLQEIRFRVPAGHVSVHWVDPAKVLQPSDAVHTVRAVRARPGIGWSAVCSDVFGYHAKLIVVAAGIWSSLLAPVNVVGQAGLALLWPGKTIKEPFVNVWAPYRQLVAFNRGDGLWVGDGTSVRNWSEKYRMASMARSRRAAGMPKEDPVELFGYRPYVADAKPCVLKEIRSGLWVATGGAKNGTLVAGWCAHQLLEKLR